MLISLKHRIALLAMPKTASTSLEAAVAGACDIVMQRAPGPKHTNLRKFDRHLRPFLSSLDAEDIETACLFREPVDWLASWHAYRSRDAIAGTPRSTRGVSFDAFVQAYLSPRPPEYAQVGRQSRFISNAEGRPGIDHLFAYENIGSYVEFLEARFGIRFKLPRLNVSSPDPKARAGIRLKNYILSRPKSSSSVDRELSDRTRQQLEKELAEDFRIHRRLVT